ncbi:TonB-dependent receptor [Sphingomonas sp. M1-B02]|uniref:TonB-dependent receptor n=1 Tax=Sphingomonas sp. M1-B02 TaxID=3114300 RepID=UPI002240BA87|nr:TonB-dependent receptor [Sphingomonas sp. S6-11]UZK67685.1 TonB-dependent receptor [Sphingomonas sp. S6-11]
MKSALFFRLTAVSVFALAVASTAQAQTAPASNDPAALQSIDTSAEQPLPADDGQDADGEIVVSGIRESLERAAEIKRDSVQVVDSIVAQDIGKLPDATTAAALQRVPGIQVSVNRNNELADVRVRGLPDVLTTVNGRETFTTTGRRLDLQDLPAEALARVDVFKSQTPDLIEGGLAGVIDLKLNKPFNFKKPTAVLSARGNYGARVDQSDPQLGLLLTNRWTTGIGEIGVLVNGTFSDSNYRRDNTVLLGLRSAATAPLNRAGTAIPNILQTFPEEGKLRRTQVNAAIQWQPSESLEVYADGFYTRFRDRGARYGANTQAFTTNSSVSNVQLSDDCFQARVTAAGQNPTLVNNVNPVTGVVTQSLQPNTLQNLCYIESATLNNPVVNLTTQARNQVQVNKQIGGGVTYDRDGTRINFDASYQTSRNDLTAVVVDIGRRVSTFTFRPDVDGIAQYQTDGAALLDSSAMFIRNSVQQNFTQAEGDLFATKLDLEHEFGGILKRVKGGVRFARRAADNYQVVLNTAVPGGNIGTATEATAVRVSTTGLPANFLTIGAPSPAINNGASFLVPNPEFILSDEGLDALRRYVRLPTGRPGYQQDRQFNAGEKTYAAYGQVEYEVPLGASAVIDGVLGGRYVRTDRSIETFTSSTAGGVTTYTPVSADTTDENFLPTATARLKFDNGIQARLGYTKTIRRPEFGQLNPSVILSLSNNPFVQSAGSAGNPDLRQQKSNAYDATLEYYFRGGYIAVAGYYRQITDRVISGPAVENFGGIDYNVTRPRNLGEATLKGIEVSGQYFLDFLPGPLAGFGVQGAFTLADSEIGGNDPLAGFPLQGVSKYNYTAGLLYDKGGLSGRLIYTYRSKYFDSDQTGSISVRPIDPARVGEVFVPPLLGYTRPAGRLDASIGYDVTSAFRIDIGGTNLLHAKTVTYLGQEYQSFEGYYDETVYSLGIRIRI